MSSDAIPRQPFDARPLQLLAAIALAAGLLVSSFPTWATLTLSGLAMGLIIFVIASGLTLVFGLMDVLNFGHGVFVALGGFIAATVLGVQGAVGDLSLGASLLAVGLAAGAGMAVAGVVGLAFERMLVRPVYGMHLKQILITMGGMIIGEEMIKMIWGPGMIALPLPQGLRGALPLPGDVVLDKFRALAALVGLTVFAALLLVLNRTKLGVLIRAGVQDREMVECLGYRIRRLFIGVFAAGSALAGLGGAMWSLYQQSVTPQMGAQVNTLIFIVIIIGGLGSTLGCFVGALAVGLLANYMGFLAPKAALFSNIALMVAVLLWRPQGLYPVGGK
ncbi:MAG: branched-chain amino acid ABC transporter permease [Paucibacter sp.]|nr:branched-chain amino acid ABC transporter permease [Roseateles sp.]